MFGVYCLDELEQPGDHIAIPFLRMPILRERLQAMPGNEIGRRRTDRFENGLADVSVRIALAAELKNLMRTPQMQFEVAHLHFRSAFGADDETLFLQLSGFTNITATAGHADTGLILGTLGVQNTFVSAGAYAYMNSGTAFYGISGALDVYGYAVNSADVPELTATA